MTIQIKETITPREGPDSRQLLHRNKLPVTLGLPALSCCQPSPRERNTTLWRMLAVLHEGYAGQTRKTAVYQIWVQCQQTGLCLLEKFEEYLHLPGERAEYVSMGHQEWYQDKLAIGRDKRLKMLSWVSCKYSYVN